MSKRQYNRKHKTDRWMRDFFEYAQIWRPMGTPCEDLPYFFLIPYPRASKRAAPHESERLMTC